MRELDACSAETTSAAGQVSNTSQSLAAGSTEQAASLEESSAALEEMAAMTKRNAECASKANDLSRQVREAADAGTGEMQEMVGAMAELKKSGDEVAKIIKTIDEIAFQTNILALNAAIEAARAGEAGAVQRPQASPIGGKTATPPLKPRMRSHSEPGAFSDCGPAPSPEPASRVMESV